MTRTEAARILARYILTEAKERGVDDVTDDFARDVIAEATRLQGTKLDTVARAALIGPALSIVKREAQSLIIKAGTVARS